MFDNWRRKFIKRGRRRTYWGLLRGRILGTFRPATHPAAEAATQTEDGHSGRGLRPGPTGFLAGRLDIRGLLAFRALGHLELDLVALFEGLEARHLDRREMREQIFAAVIRRDEAVPLRVVEPLYRTGWHSPPSLHVATRGSPLSYA